MNVSLQTLGGPTIIVAVAGVRLITDPTFDPPGVYQAETAPQPLTKTMGPALPVDRIGPIDAVLLSHDQHVDNLDRAGRALLNDAPLILSTPEAAARLGGHAVGLDAWSPFRLGEDLSILVTALPARHGPPGAEATTGPVTGFLLSGPAIPTIYISGDNASVEIVGEIARRSAPIDIAILFVGAAVLPWLFAGAPLTLDNAAAVEATKLLNPRVVLPVHYDGWSHLTESIDQLFTTFARAGLSDRLHAPTHGEVATFS